MTTGEMNFSTATREVKKFEDTPIAPGTYDAVLQTSKAEVRESKSGPVPYLNYYMDIPTIQNSNGTPARLYHRLFLTFTKGKDGATMLDRQGGLVNLAQATGDHPAFAVSSKDGGETWYGEDVATFEGKTGEAIYAIAPGAVLSWLKNQQGKTVRVRVKMSKEQTVNGKTYPAKPEVSAFEEAPQPSVYEAPVNGEGGRRGRRVSL